MKTELRPSKTAEEPRGYYGVEPVKEKAGTGGLHATRSRMQMPSKIPCRECPLRTDAAPGFLGGYTPEMYLNILHSPASVACHCSKGFHAGDIAKQRHCTGVAGYRANVGVRCGSSADLATQALADGYQRDIREDFFASPRDFYDHHKPAQLALTNASRPAYPEDWGHNQEEEV